MTWRVILLAVATTVRLPSLAAVSALLVTPAPRRYMSVYILTGATFTITFGLLVVWLFNGIETSPGFQRPRAIAELCLGALFLAVAVVVASRAGATSTTGPTPEKPSQWMDQLNRHVTVPKAALAGPVTHIPGLLYLIALNLIASADLHARRGLFEVLLFNAIWFAIPIAGLVISLRSPQLAARAVTIVEQRMRQHGRAIIVVVSVAVGIVLLILGLQGL